MEYGIELAGSGYSQEEYEDIRLCLETLLSVREGSQPFDREFGIDYDGIVGFPMNVAKNMLSLEIMEKVDKYEPRAKVERIEFRTGKDGMLLPQIYLKKGE